MPAGFSVTQKIERPPAVVWAYLTDFQKARDWMTGVEAMTQTAEGPLEIGTRFTFRSRGKQRETRVTALDPGRRIALTSTQGGVTGTQLSLHAVCEATGAWKLLHPLIAFAMKQSDSSQLAKLKAAMDRGG